MEKLVTGRAKKELENLVVDNPDLERLEALLDQFNIFEAMGAVNQELRHSDFLAFLMDPVQPHGLGEDFIKGLLQKSLIGVPPESISITPIDLDIWSLDNLQVRREWRNIDILLINDNDQTDNQKFVVVIENKVTGGEHSGQLARYRKMVRERFTEFKRLGLFLTPEGIEPSDEWYIPISYDLIADLIKRFIQTRHSTLGPDVLTMMEHYEQMLRRHIVSESEIAELCRRIYKKHQRALDMIYEYRPDLQDEFRIILEELIKEHDELVFEYSTKTYIRFYPAEWDIPLFKGGDWVPSGMMVLIEFYNGQDRLDLKLTAGPGRPEVSEKLFKMAEENQKATPFQTFFREPRSKWNTIYKRQIISKDEYESMDMGSLEEKIYTGWNAFLEHDLPVIRQTIMDQDWVKEGIE